MSGLQHLPALVLTTFLHLFSLMLHPLSKLLQFRTREVLPPSDPLNETPPESSIALPDATSLSALDISHLYSLSNASPAGSLNLYIQLHLEQRFNTMLARWFSRPLAFREALQITQSAISGSAVVSYAIPSPSWESKDLDIYTPVGQAFSEMLEHLTEVQGYTLVQAWPHQGIAQGPLIKGTAQSQPGPKPPPKYYSSRARYISRIVTLEKVDTSATGSEVLPLRVDLVCSETSEALLPITDFHSTCVVNCITSCGVIIGYPKLTFGRENAKRRQAQGGSKAHLEKYRQRGFAVVEQDPPPPCSPSTCSMLRRSFRDVACLAIPFPGCKHPLDGVPDVSWSLQGPCPYPCPLESCSYRLSV